jgi:hypothetical protein
MAKSIEGSLSSDLRFDILSQLKPQSENIFPLVALVNNQLANFRALFPRIWSISGRKSLTL